MTDRSERELSVHEEIGYRGPVSSSAPEHVTKPEATVSYTVDPDALAVPHKDGWDIDSTHDVASQIRARLAETKRWDQTNPRAEVEKRAAEQKLPSKLPGRR